MTTASPADQPTSISVDAIIDDLGRQLGQKDVLVTQLKLALGAVTAELHAVKAELAEVLDREMGPERDPG